MITLERAYQLLISEKNNHIPIEIVELPNVYLFCMVAIETARKNKRGVPLIVGLIRDSVDKLTGEICQYDISSDGGAAYSNGIRIDPKRVIKNA